MDVCLVMAVITCVNADVFTEEFLHGRLELRAVFRHIKASKCDIRRFQTPSERRSIVSVRGVYLLVVDEPLPEIMGSLGLSNAGRRESGVIPRYGAVAVEFCPIALL